MDDGERIAEIRQHVEVYDFAYDRQHCDNHMVDEDFDVDDAVMAVVSGEVIEHAPERSRWLFCGSVSRLRQDVRFRGRWIHVSVQYDEDSAITLVTMYRPTVWQWRSEKVRR